MSSIPLTERLTMLAIITLAAILLLSPGCREPETTIQTAGGGKIDTESMVIARVGDTDIMLKDLIFSVPAFAYLQQNLIGSEIFSQEARKRGVYPTEEKIQEAYDKQIQGQGGEEGILKQFPPSIPRDVALKYFRNQYVLTQLLQQAIMEDEFVKKQGTPTEDQITQVWNEREQSFRTSIAAERKIAADQVTMDMARQQIEDQLKQQWLGQNGAKFMDDLTKSYPVENYLLQQYSTTQTEEVIVPEVGQRSAQPGEGGVSPQGTPPGQPGGQGN